MASLTVVRPGMLTTVQDLGRWGSQAEGVPVAGPMDWYSHRSANRLAGNSDEEAALEITLIGPTLAADADLACAVAGAEFELTVDGRSVPMHAPFAVPAGSTLRFGNRLAGARATLAVRGGMDAAPLFGSRSTSIISRMGPFGGRALVAGDVLAIGGAPASAHPAAPRPLPPPRGGARLRVIVGPHTEHFTASARESLLQARFIVTPQSNRMGYRLEGPPLLHAAAAADILSDATPIGSLQVPASGQPILLMADRQTTGGYPKIATVITADLPLAGQLAPGDWIEFTSVSRADAVQALREQERRLAGHE